ncbi:MBL fold metallo-hydrolase [Photobacterium sp.]|uniref:MBL fold metallo-hydrolase n=1 Tax=Photobacterium sp. TaxID=660 RepID=UPI00299EDC75|nr:MBL fold metallo-hydrolase [Photobacterium sp.]MDX1303679.1 MBL fold metallo-hydrolase [Photobacterium sp.]
MKITHHGARTGVTGSCHEVLVGEHGLLIDCGLFQGSENTGSFDIEFSIGHIRGLLLTHCHIDHVGRIPWLLAAGYKGPIYATEATAALLPLMLEDGLKIQLGLNRSQCEHFTSVVKKKLIPIPYDCWAQLVLPSGEVVSIRFQPAGHILGSAYIEMKMPDNQVVVFSGDLGPCNTPLLVDPQSPQQVDTLIIESTYGDTAHNSVSVREQQLKEIVQRSFTDGGTILIPAFSVGRTQELLFDIENIIATAVPGNQVVNWESIPIILDSPLAGEITQQYREFKQLWAREAKDRYQQGRHPLSFSQCITINSHADHQALVNRLKTTGEPAIVVAASGMCTGGRILNYLEALLADARTDVILVGYQARGTLGRELIQGREKVKINGNDIEVKAKIHQMEGYSAHADQADLLKFVDGIELGPKKIHVIHGDCEAQRALAEKLKAVKPEAEVVTGTEMK